MSSGCLPLLTKEMLFIWSVRRYSPSFVTARVGVVSARVGGVS